MTNEERETIVQIVEKAFDGCYGFGGVPFTQDHSARLTICRTIVAQIRALPTTEEVNNDVEQDTKVQGGHS